MERVGPPHFILFPIPTYPLPAKIVGFSLEMDQDPDIFSFLFPLPRLGPDEGGEAGKGQLSKKSSKVAQQVWSSF